MPGHGKTIHDDSYYTYDRLLALSRMKLLDACREARIGSVRLKRLFKEAGIERSTYPREYKGRPGPLSSVTNKQLIAWGKSMSMHQIGDMLDITANTVENLYAKRGLEKPPLMCEDDWLAGGTPELSCRGDCETCCHLAECERRERLGLPLLNEGLTKDDPRWYVERVIEAMKVAS